MYGRWEGELRFHRRHMWPVPSPPTPSLAIPTNSSVFIDPNSFSKDGRKIRVGDCALFKPPQYSPPFVGIIRRLVVGKEDNLSLSVNWLYRPADVKLGKGASLRAAPNEVFYSFHKDEIPAASLLHPCKVAFLREGVQIPSDTPSFVCRRVYDIENKCLWWLTDQDYINERQEEVNQLLDKTRIEMYGSVQPGGRSPKPLDGPNVGTTQIKSNSDNVPNTSSSIPSQVKTRKREHSVHSSDSVKRERLSKADDADSGQVRPEYILKTEIAKFTDKGGLINFEGVEKLIQLMQAKRAEKKIDLPCRIMLVDVISFTDKFDCLSRFVQLRGLLVLDEWLQEVHKGKIDDGSLKESDKSVEEFLFALLRALDKLPVNLHALQTCNIGKSVNHLRGHKNYEIQRKAKCLVDTWKKRVEAEMNIIETKSGTSRGRSWSSKSMVSEVSHLSSLRISRSSEAGAKSSISQNPELKVQEARHNSGEAVAKSPMSSGFTKLPAPAAGSLDMTLTAIKEEKSSNSSQSPNNSQSRFTDHEKTGTSCRDDARSSVTGSLIVTKVSCGVSRSRNPNLQGSVISGVQKQESLGNSISGNQNFDFEKSSPTIGTSHEKVADVSLVDNGNNHRLIVRLPSTSRSPTRTANGVSPEDTSNKFGKGSPLVHSEKQDHNDRKVREKVDEVKVATIGAPCDGHDGDGGIGERLAQASGVTLKTEKSFEASYSSINALVESCAKFSEASVAASVNDDVGINLLASVAAGEMSRSDASPVGSPESKTPLPEDSCSKYKAKLRPRIEDGCRSEDPSVINGHVMVEQDSNAIDMTTEVKPTGPRENASAVFSSSDARNGCKEGDEGAVQCEDYRKSSPDRSRSSNFSNSKPNSRCPSEDNNDACADEKVMGKNVAVTDGAATSTKARVKDESASWSSSERHDDQKKLVHRQLSSSNLVSPKQPHVRLKNEDSAISTTSCGGDGLELKTEEPDDKKAGSQHTLENINKTEDLDCIPGGLAPSDKVPSVVQKPCLKSGDVVEAECSQVPSSRVNFSTVTSPVSEMSIKLDFDLNEVLPNDDVIQGESERSSIPGSSSNVHMPCPLPSSCSPVTGIRPASITIAAAARGPFFPPENLLRGKVELGWKGSAATSAFRPAEPRKVVEVPLTISDNPTNKQAPPRLDFDLNVGAVDDDIQYNAPLTFLEPGIRALNGGGLDLDLNACEESPEVGQLSVCNSKLHITQLPTRSLPNQSRDLNFDLNNGPGTEECGRELKPIAKNSMQFLHAVPRVGMNNMDMVNFSSWFPPSNTYPSILPGRGEQSYPIIPAATAGTSFNHEMFRGPVLSSSPAVAFQSTTPFQYPVFPFETTFPLPSNAFSSAYMDSSSGGPLCFPTIPSQLVGPSGVVSTPYRPYVMNLPGGSSNVGPNSRNWGSQGLDLNAGPGGTDLERREYEKLPSALRQLPIAGSQTLSDDQLKMFQQMSGGGVSKRKELDGGWDGDGISYKHPSWR